MSISKQLKMLPRTIESFVRNFNVVTSEELTLEAYSIYLSTNSKQHHYNGKTVDQWLQEEVTKYQHTRNSN